MVAVLSVAACSDSTPGAGPPPPVGSDDSPPMAGTEEPELILIPRDFRRQPPFAGRFADVSSAHVIDLAATRFETTPREGIDRFGSPDTSPFRPDLIRRPFAGAPDDLFIVQAASPRRVVELRRTLESLGCEINAYVPRYAYLVRLTQAEYVELSRRPEVFWLGLFQPAWRIAPKLDYLRETYPDRILRMTIRIDPSILETEDAVRGAVANAGFSVLEIARRSHDWKVRAEGAVELLDGVALMRGVLWIERFGGYVLHNNQARTSASVPTGRGGSNGPIMDVEDVWARGIRGEGQIASASDTGLSTGDFNTLHADFGRMGSATNPRRVVAAYALGRTNDWSDDQSLGGGHGTHTSGSIVGNGFNSGADPANDSFPPSCFAGIAPKAQFVFQSVMDGGGGLGGIPTDLNTLFQQAYADGARVHSNSWGTSSAGVYDADAQDIDEFVWNNPDMVVTFSAGNAGVDGRRFTGFTCMSTGDPIDGVIDTDSIGPPGTAKSCITVGASENYRPTYTYEIPAGDCSSSDGVEQMTWGWFSSCAFSTTPIFEDLIANNASGMVPFSSRGPTDDSRFKPDVVAPGSGIISTRTDVNQTYEQWGVCNVPMSLRPYYVSQGGTSMSNPLTAGAATLVRQYYVDGWHPNGSSTTHTSPVSADGFNPSAALVKATLINGAFDMSPGQYGTGGTQEIPAAWDSGSDLPNNAEGFGRVDLEGSLFPGAGFGHNPARRLEVHDVTTGLSTGQSQIFPISVGSTAEPLTVTLVWSDPFAATAAAVTLVNDLDLRVTAPGGTDYFPNGIDRTSGVDRRNNVEQVRVSAPQTGTWTVTVEGFNVPGNSQSGSTTQPYALVISGVLAPPCTTPGTPVGLTAQPNGDNRIDLSWTAVPSDSYRVYRASQSGGPYTQIASGVLGSSYSDTSGVSGGQTYYYRVSAFNEVECESGQSNEASATATGGCAELPTFGGLQSVAPLPGGGCGLRLDWAAGTNNCGSAPLVYNVYRSTTSGFTPGPGTLLSACVAGTSYDDTTVMDGVTYHYVVRAEDDSTGMGGPCRAGVEGNSSVEIGGQASGAPVPTTLYTHDFETGSGLDDWSTGTFGGSPTSDWEGIQTCAANSGSNIFRFGGTGCTDDYGGNRFQFAQPGGGAGIAVPAGTTNTTLRFWHRWRFENDVDGGFLALSLDGAGYSLVPGSAISGVSYNGSTSNNGFPAFTGAQATFVESVVALDGVCDAISGGSSGCAGQTLYIAFGADTNMNGNDDGWFLDDVEVTADAPGVCDQPPGPVRFLTASAASGQVTLDWENPGAPYGQTMIRYDTAGPPASVAEGTLLVNQNDGSGGHGRTVHTGLTNGTTYYYSAFVDNGSGTYSGRTIVSARPFDTSGSVKWAYSTGASAMSPPGIGSVFAASNDRVLHSMLEGAAGGPWPAGWTPFAMNGPSQARPPIIPITLGPATKVAFVSSQDGRVYAVNAGSGQEIWASPVLGEMVVAAPAGMFTAFGGAYDLIVAGTRNSATGSELVGLNLSDGTVAWSFDNGSSPIGIISGMGAIDYTTNRVFFTSRTRTGGSSSTVWCVQFTGNSASLVWSRDVGESDSSPVLAGSRLYVGNNAGQIHALDAATGAPQWSSPFSTLDGPVKETIWVDGATLLFSTTDDVWAVSDAGTAASLVWNISSIPNPSMPIFLSGLSRAYVGASNGRVYEIDTSNPTSPASVLLGDGSAAIGSPAVDTVNDLLHVGSDQGRLYAITVPLQ